jgi:hypothetical protein
MKTKLILIMLVLVSSAFVAVGCSGDNGYEPVVCGTHCQGIYFDLEERGPGVTKEFCNDTTKDETYICIEIDSSNIRIVRAGSRLLDIFPQYPPNGTTLPQGNISVDSSSCEALVDIPNRSLTCIERNGSYEIVGTQSPLLDEFPEYPPPKGEFITEACEGLATIRNGMFTCIERNGTYEVVRSNSPLLDEYPQYPLPTTP